MSTFRHSQSGASKTLDVSSAAVNFVAGDFGTPKQPYLRLQVQVDAVIVTYDGTTPSATNGELLAPGGAGYFLRTDVLNWKFIRSNSDAKVFAQPCDIISPNNN